LLLTDLLSRHDEGIKQLELALELDPLSTVVLHNLAMRKRNARNFDEAGELYRRALEIKPDNVYYQIQYAYYFNWTQDGDEAIKQAARALEMAPDIWQTNACYGWILNYIGGPRAEVIEYFDRACELSPDNDIPYAEFGRLYYRILNNYEMAVPLYLKAVEVNPKAHGSYNRLAYCYAGTGEYEKAIETVEKAIELVPFRPHYINTRADIHFAFGEFDETIDDYQLFFEMWPDNPYTTDVLTNMAKACTFGRRYDLADSIYSVLLKTADSTMRPVARRRLTLPARHQGKFRQTIQMMQEWIDVEEPRLGKHWQSVYTLYDMGRIHLDYLHEVDSAIAQFARAKEIVWSIDSTHLWNVILEGRIAEAHAIARDDVFAREALRGCRNTIDTTKSGQKNVYLRQVALTEYHLGNYDSAAIAIDTRPNNGF